MNEMRVPVLIVGDGPVGLSTAIGLRRFGIDCLLVERHPSTSLFPKGRGINKRTMEIFRQWGIEDKVTAAGLPREESLSVYLGDTLTASTFRRFGSEERIGRGYSPTEHFICSQDALEPVLRVHAEALGADVRFGTRLAAFDENNNNVCAELRAADGGALRVRCDYLVAADGGRSTVREQLGTPAIDDPMREYVPVARPGHRAPHVWCERDGVRHSTLDLFGDAFVVLTDPTGWNGLGAVVDAADDWKAPLRWHAIDAVGWPDVYGLRPGGMVLVRPDGHVAWRSRETPKNVARELRAALDQATGA